MHELYAAAEAYPYAAFFILPFLGSAGIPLPEDAILFFLGTLISKNTVALLPGVVSVYCGILLSDLLIYAAGFRYGRRIITHRLFRRVLPPGRLAAVEKAFARRGPYVILIGRQIFWVRAKILLVAGITRIPLSRFLLLDAVAAMLTVSGTVTLGFAGEAWLIRLKSFVAGIGDTAPAIVIAGLILLVGCLSIMLARRRIASAAAPWWSRLREQLP